MQPNRNSRKSEAGRHPWQRSRTVYAVALLALAAFILTTAQDCPLWPPKTGNIAGCVKNQSSIPMEDVAVYGPPSPPAETNPYGNYGFSDLDADVEYMLSFDAGTRYPIGRERATVRAMDTVYCNCTMVLKGSTVTRAASQSFSVSSDGHQLDVTGNSLQQETTATPVSRPAAYSGSVFVQLTPYDSQDPAQLHALPGSCEGLESFGTVIPLAFVAAIDVSVTDSTGQNLEPLSGQPAALTVPVPQAMESSVWSAGGCGMWWFSLSDFRWHQQGTATYDAQSRQLVGSIDRFGTWAFGITYDVGYVYGRVIDESGNSIAGAAVRCWGDGWMSDADADGRAISAHDGTFGGYAVACNREVHVQASKRGYETATLALDSAPGCGQSKNIGDLVLWPEGTQPMSATFSADPDPVPAGTSSSFFVYVVDGNGVPLEGATVEMGIGWPGFGEARTSEISLLTNSDGVASEVWYTAPASAYPGEMSYQLVYTVEKQGYESIQDEAYVGIVPVSQGTTIRFVDSDGSDVNFYSNGQLVYVEVTDPSLAGTSMLANAVEINGVTYDVSATSEPGTFVSDGLDLDVGSGTELTATYIDPADPTDTASDSAVYGFVPG